MLDTLVEDNAFQTFPPSTEFTACLDAGKLPLSNDDIWAIFARW